MGMNKKAVFPPRDDRGGVREWGVKLTPDGGYQQR